MYRNRQGYGDGEGVRDGNVNGNGDGDGNRSRNCKGKGDDNGDGVHDKSGRLISWLHFNFLVVIVWFRSCNHMNGVMIYIMLLMQNVESNPGPGPPTVCNLSVRTYNCNGLGNIDKFRRVLVNVRREVGHGGVVLLQETHIKDENI